MNNHNTVIDNGSVAGFQVNEATYGVVVPVILGTSRQSANIIDYFNFTTIKNTSTTHTGKGGGSSTTTVTYTYKAAVLLALCEGKVAGVGQVWIDTDTITTLAAAGLTLFDGTDGQSIWSYTAPVAPTHALPYSGLAYVAGYIDLDSDAAVQQYNFEIKGDLLTSGDGTDVNPGAVTEYILADLGFTSDNVHASSMTDFKNFCAASDLFITEALTDQSKAYEIVNRLCEMTNTIVFWSQSKMKFVPRCESAITGNNVTYTPNTTPEYDLTEDDFLEDDDGKLVTWERTDNAETYNHVTVEFTNRANSYETETVDYQILADINKRGLRPMSTVTYHEIHTKARAEYVAQMLALDSCYGRNTYKFKLGLMHSLLEPGDIVTLTCTAAGLNKLPVIIESITEDGDEAYQCEAKYRPFGAYSPAKYFVYDADRGALDRNVEPGATQTPLFYETPFLDGSHNIGVAACGVNNQTWGGAGVWVSYDGTQYSQVGRINGPGRYGKLVSTITAGATSATVQLADTSTQLLSASADAADANATLIAIGDEWMAYETATLVSAGRYTLSGLRRGRYGSTAAAHSANEDFLRYDSDGFLYPYQTSDIGRTLHVKLTAQNVFGFNEQSLDEVTEYTYTIRGSGSLSRIERATKTIDPAGWTAFAFAEAFSSAPTFVAYCNTTGGAVYWRNVTATGFEALIQNTSTLADMIGEFTYDAQGW